MWLLLSFLKKSLSSWEIATEWIWYGCIDELKIFLTPYKKSVTMTIHLMLGIPTAWLILHLIAKSLASIVVIFTIWWIVLMISLLCKWICNIEIATLFLMLASERTIEEWELLEALMAMLSRLCIWFLILWVYAWKENWSKKEFISLFLGKTLHWKEKKRRKIHYIYCPCWLMDCVIGIVI